MCTVFHRKPQKCLLGHYSSFSDCGNCLLSPLQLTAPLPFPWPPRTDHQLPLVVCSPRRSYSPSVVSHWRAASRGHRGQATGLAVTQIPSPSVPCSTPLRFQKPQTWHPAHSDLIPRLLQFASYLGHGRFHLQTLWAVLPGSCIQYSPDAADYMFFFQVWDPPLDYLHSKQRGSILFSCAKPTQVHFCSTPLGTTLSSQNNSTLEQSPQTGFSRRVTHFIL